jgi:hypothetical protein
LFVTWHTPRYSAEQHAGLGVAVLANPAGLTDLGRALAPATWRA